MDTCQRGHLIFEKKCRACNKLKKEWYEKLKQDEFKDIEGFKESNVQLRTIQMELDRHKNFQSKEAYEATLNYYQWARSKASEGRFKSPEDRLIWENHAEGLSRRKISPFVSLDGSWITRKLSRIESYLKSGVIGSVSLSSHVF